MKTLIFKSGKSAFYRVDVDDVIWIERVKGKTIVHLIDRDVTLSLPFNYVLESLGNEFIQCHRSHAVNFSHVVEFSYQKIFLDKIELPIGKSYKNNFMSFMTNKSSLIEVNKK